MGDVADFMVECQQGLHPGFDDDGCYEGEDFKNGWPTKQSKVKDRLKWHDRPLGHPEVMSVGKYKGELLDSVPKEYLATSAMRNYAQLPENAREYIKANKEYFKEFAKQLSRQKVNEKFKELFGDD